MGAWTVDMNQKRVVAVLVFFFVVGFCLVHLEGEKTRHARKIARLNGQMLAFDHQSWRARAQLAKLCSPAELRERSERLALGTLAPVAAAEAGMASGEELAVAASGLR